MRMEKMTTKEPKLGRSVEEKYKWALELVSISQSVIQLFATLLLYLLTTVWDWIQIIWNNSQNLSYSDIVNYFHCLWANLTATMTIEVISATESEGALLGPVVEGRQITIPTLRLNSQNIEDFYTNDSNILTQVSRGMDDLILGHCCSGSSNYNSSDGEHDSGLVFTDPEENDSLDGAHSPSPLPIMPPSAACSINSNRRDSDSSDVSSDGHDDEKDPKANSETGIKLMTQVESMFSNDHLAKDGFLLKHVRRRSDGYVSLKLVAGLRKVKQISRDFDVILNTLRKSEKLEINSEGTKIRRIEPLTQYLKSLPVAGNKDKEKDSNGKVTSDRQGHYNNGASSDSAQDDSRVNGKGHHKKIYRKDSNYSSCSSNPGSRNGSFSMPYQTGNEFLYRNPMMVFPPGDDVPQQIVNRRRGGSLPMPMDQPQQQQPHYLNYYQQYQSHHGHHGQRNSMHLVPNSSPPTGAGFHHRPKSNSYCEGTDRKNSIGGTSLWLQRRQSANSRATTDSNISVFVIRQPRGPDGTKGFARG